MGEKLNQYNYINVCKTDADAFCFSSKQTPYLKGEMRELGEKTLGRACTAGRTERVTYVGEF